jgi:type I restriction enzyme S subunit
MNSKDDAGGMGSRGKGRLVPRLRFPEFWDAGEWEEKKLGEVGEFKNGINFSADKKGRGILTIDVLNMYGSGIEVQLDSLYRVDVDTKDYVLRDCDILFVRSSLKRDGIGWPSLFREFSEPVLFCGFLIRLRLESLQLTNPEFLLYCLRSDSGRRKIICVSGTAAITNISQDSLKIISVSFPNLAEQQKIVDCLTSIDIHITLETQKLDTLKTHKKGLMQQLFPAAGQTLPQLRFLEFRNAGKWNLTSLGKVSNITSGGTPNRSNKEFWNGKIPWVTTSLIDFNTIEKSDQYISESGLKGSSAKLFPENTILMAMYGQGKTRGKVAILGIEATTNQACAAILLGKILNKNFLFHNLAGRYDEIRELSNRGGQENLSAGLIEQIPISYPVDKNEQKKIADCLNSVDELIALQAQKIDALKLHKKGLMQQLFPSLEETI